MFYGWFIVALFFFAGAFSGATLWYGFTAFFDPLMNEFGWSYTAISFAASLRGTEVALLDVFVGFLLDRFGSRRIILTASILICLGFLMLSQVHSLTTFYLSFVLISCGATGFGTLVCAWVLSRWFSKRLGLALGITTAGYGAAGFAVPVIVYLLNLLGFRSVFIIFGVLALVIGGLLTYFVRNRPEEIGCGPDGVPLHDGQHISEQVNTQTAKLIFPARDHTFKEAISRLPFWTITYVTVVAIFSVIMVTTHVMPYLEHLSYSRYTASIVAMMIPALSIIGRLGAGWASDYLNHKLALALMLMGQLVGVVLFLNAHLLFALIPFVVLFSVSYGGIFVLRLAVLKDYFGKAYIGSIMGLCFGLGAIGSVCGPPLAGWIFDTTGSYDLAWIISSVLLLIGIPLVLLTKSPSPE